MMALIAQELESFQLLAAVVLVVLCLRAQYASKVIHTSATASIFIALVNLLVIALACSTPTRNLSKTLS